jgi:hypothetical protein
MKLLRFVQLVLWCVLPTHWFVSAAFAADPDSLLTRTVRPGVIHRSIVDSRGPWKIHILEIDLRRNDLFIESAHAADRVYGRETTSGMAARSSDSSAAVVAALNADFFNLETGETVNNQIAGGEVLRAVIPVGDPGSEETVVRSQIGFRSDNRPVLGRFVFHGEIVWGGGRTTPLAAVNVMRSRTPFALFTRWWGIETGKDSSRRNVVELPLRRVGRRGDTLIAIVSAPARRGGGSRLSADEVVIATTRHPEFFDSIGVAAGDTVRVLCAFTPQIHDVRSLVGGIPWLVRDGKPFVAARENLEGAREVFSTTRHPRTGIGFSRDSLTAYFLSVDGRQASSAGMSLVEFSELMIARGVYQGLNLDGGGSTTMVIDGAVVNSPSDAAGERPVANCLLLMERRRHQ